MLKTIKNKNISWSHIQNPNKKDWDFLETKLQIPTNIMLEMTEKIQQPRLEEFADNLYININVPLFNRLKQTTEAGDLHIFLTSQGLTTVIFKPNLPVKSIFHHLEKSERFRQKIMIKDNGYFLINFLTELTNLSFDKINHINENIDWVKETIFEEDNDNDTVREISKIKLDILMFQRILKPQKNILETLLQEKYPPINTPEKISLIHQLIRTNIKVWNSIESAQEIIESLEVTNNSIVSFKLNNTMRFLAAVSLITFAMSVTLGIFTLIPFGSFGVAHEFIKFWLALFSLFFIAVLSFWLFRKKRWF
jgi:Mg2+ and Co2+ transporter CorA